MRLPLTWARRSLASRGLVRTSKVAGSALLDLSFDLRYGTETMRWVWVEDLGANSEHDVNAVGYRATKARSLQKLISKLDLPRDRAFVDLGSGKGRVLLLAAQLGFQKVVGVDTELCQKPHDLALVYFLVVGLEPVRAVPPQVPAEHEGV